MLDLLSNQQTSIHSGSVRIMLHSIFFSLSLSLSFFFVQYIFALFIILLSQKFFVENLYRLSASMPDTMSSMQILLSQRKKNFIILFFIGGWQCLALACTVYV